jgi:hypothetical protein
VRDVEQQVLAHIAEAYQRYQHAGEQLERAIDEASANGAAPPVDALRIDFDAQLAVTDSAIAFAALCAPEGPDLDDVPGAAFVLAMHQAGAAMGAGELEGLARSFEAWLADLRRWTPAHIAMPPPRPMSPGHSHVLATVGQWWVFHHERMHDEVVAMLATATAQAGATAIGVGAEDELITVTTFGLRTASGVQRRSETVHRMVQWVKNLRR